MLEVREKSFDYYQLLRRIESHVERNGLDGLTLRRAGAIAGMEATHFSVFFHSKVGITFRAWRRQERIKRALQAFCVEDVLITDVAYTVGFEDLTAFERAFRQLVGMTPREFKKRNRPCP